MAADLTDERFSKKPKLNISGIEIDVEKSNDGKLTAHAGRARQETEQDEDNDFYTNEVAGKRKETPSLTQDPLNFDTPTIDVSVTTNKKFGVDLEIPKLKGSVLYNLKPLPDKLKIVETAPIVLNENKITVSSGVPTSNFKAPSISLEAEFPRVKISGGPSSVNLEANIPNAGLNGNVNIKADLPKVSLNGPTLHVPNEVSSFTKKGSTLKIDADLPKAGLGQPALNIEASVPSASLSNASLAFEPSTLNFGVF